MSLLKVAAVVVGGIVVFFALNFVWHALLALVTTLIIVRSSQAADMSRTR